jgi:hypothetical protein
VNDIDGIALAFWLFVGLAVFLVAAGGLEWLHSRPDRRWIRRLQRLERARVDWAARCIEQQSFWRK